MKAELIKLAKTCAQEYSWIYDENWNDRYVHRDGKYLVLAKCVDEPEGVFYTLHLKTYSLNRITEDRQFYEGKYKGMYGFLTALSMSKHFGKF